VKLLLDTHIWIWGLLTPHKLGRRVTRELASLHNEIWLSPV
jgi:PIN domain nuclease of toxin-antitoxin system